MSAKRIAIFNHGPGRQHGAALMVMLIIMIVGVAAIFVSALNSSALQISRDKVTADALAQAKEALIGRAVADLTSPGSLPCPDIDDSGIAQSTVAPTPGSCPSYIGRLPWKTLGLPDLRDGSGERLWYALSPNFRDYINSSTPATTNPINSNRAGTLQVYDNSGTTLLTPAGSEAVAIVFAPGDVVASKQRDAANQNIATNYLDIGPNNINNGTFTYPNGPFIVADKTSSFNDRLMIIRKRDIIPVVEMRVAKELTKAFAAYLAAKGGYPNPANFPNDTTTPVCIGEIPTSALTTLPSWFTNNKWSDVIYYTAVTTSLVGGGAAGTGNKGWGKKGKWKSGGGGGGGITGTGTGCYATALSVSGTSANALFFMPGPSLGIARTTPMSSNPNNLSSYLEDNENQIIDNIYVLPGSTNPISNDSLYILP